MSKPPDSFVELNKTLTLCEYKSGGSLGFWLYDNMRGVNLAMRAKTERAAFIEALEYYQERSSELEAQLVTITKKVDAFVASVTNEEED